MQMAKSKGGPVTATESPASQEHATQCCRLIGRIFPIVFSSAPPSLPLVEAGKSLTKDRVQAHELPTGQDAGL